MNLFSKKFQKIFKIACIAVISVIIFVLLVTIIIHYFVSPLEKPRIPYFMEFENYPRRGV